MIPVDASRLNPLATGNINPVMTWNTNPDGSRSRSDVQATNQDGVPLWNVEILRTVRSFGEDRTEGVNVEVPAAAMPAIKQLSPVAFRDLEADFYVSRGNLRQRWSASALHDSKPAAPQEK